MVWLWRCFRLRSVTKLKFKKRSGTERSQNSRKLWTGTFLGCALRYHTAHRQVTRTGAIIARESADIHRLDATKLLVRVAEKRKALRVAREEVVMAKKTVQQLEDESSRYAAWNMPYEMSDKEKEDLEQAREALEGAEKKYLQAIDNLRLGEQCFLHVSRERKRENERQRTLDNEGGEANENPRSHDTYSISDIGAGLNLLRNRPPVLWSVASQAMQTVEHTSHLIRAERNVVKHLQKVLRRLCLAEKLALQKAGLGCLPGERQRTTKEIHSSERRMKLLQHEQRTKYLEFVVLAVQASLHATGVQDNAEIAPLTQEEQLDYNERCLALAHRYWNLYENHRNQTKNLKWCIERHKAPFSERILKTEEIETVFAIETVHQRMHHTQAINEFEAELFELRDQLMARGLDPDPGNGALDYDLIGVDHPEYAGNHPRDGRTASEGTTAHGAQLESHGLRTADIQAWLAGLDAGLSDENKPDEHGYYSSENDSVSPHDASSQVRRIPRKTARMQERKRDIEYGDMTFGVV